MRAGELPRLALRAALGVLVVGAALVLATGSAGTRDASGASQRLVAGLGLGTAIDLSGDAAAFDVRLGTPPAPGTDPANLAAAWLADPAAERAERR